MNAPTLALEGQNVAPRAPEAGIAPSLERRRLRIYLVQMLADIGLLFGSFALAAYIYLAAGGPAGQPLLAAQLMLPIFLTIAWHNGTYSLGSLTDWRASSIRMVLALLIASALLNFLAFFVSLNANFSRVVFVAGLAGAIVAMSAVRFAMARWIRARRCS